MASIPTITEFENAGLDLETIARVANVGTTGDTTTNREATVFDTLFGRLKKIGYIAPVGYSGSISFTTSDNLKTITRSGIQYAPIPSSLPFTTSNWTTDSSKFYVVGNSSIDTTNISYDNTSSGLSSTNIQDAINELENEKLGQQTTDESYTIGPGLDFASIGSALIEISKKRPRYASSQNTVTLTLDDSFVMNEQVRINGLDFGFVTITGSALYTDITTAAVTTSILGQKGLFLAQNGAILPIINKKFDLGSQSSSGVVGIVCVYGSTAVMKSNGGFRNGKTGLYAAYGSTISCETVTITNAYLYNVHSNGGASISLKDSTLTGALTNGLLAVTSSINVYNCNCRKYGTSNTADIKVISGSIITANSSLGGVIHGSTPTARNVITANGLVIG